MDGQERFRVAANTWLELNSDIEEFSKEYKKMRLQADELRKEIIDYMKENKITTVSMCDGSVLLRCRETKRKRRPTPDEAIVKIATYTGDQGTAEALYNHVWKDSCEVVTSHSLSKRCVR